MKLNRAGIAYLARTEQKMRRIDDGRKFSYFDFMSTFGGRIDALQPDA